MRVVRDAEALAAAVDAGRREAKSAFGDESLFEQLAQGNSEAFRGAGSEITWDQALAQRGRDAAEAPMRPEDQHSDPLDRQHEGYRASQHLQDGPGTGQSERAADRQPVDQRNSLSQQAQGEHGDHQESQAAQR